MSYETNIITSERVTYCFDSPVKVLLKICCDITFVKVLEPSSKGDFDESASKNDLSRNIRPFSLSSSAACTACFINTTAFNWRCEVVNLSKSRIGGKAEDIVAWHITKENRDTKCLPTKFEAGQD